MSIVLNSEASHRNLNLDIQCGNAGNPDEAIARFCRITELNPNNPDALINPAMLQDSGPEEIRFKRATLLANSVRHGDREEAKSLFLEILKARPSHYGAWNNLGKLLFETGYTSAAHTSYSAAVTYHPKEPVAHLNFGNVLLHMDDLDAAKKHFEIALVIDPSQFEAHQGLSSVLQRQGDEGVATYHRDIGFGGRALSYMDYQGQEEPVPLLILASSIGGNIPWRFLIDQGLFQTTIIATEYFDIQLKLPSHQLIFNAIGDADLCHKGLDIATRLIEMSGAPVINHPNAVKKTGRLMNTRRLAGVSGVIVPRMVRLTKMEILSGSAMEKLAQEQMMFPLLLRAPGFHGGNYLERIDVPEALKSTVEKLPGENLLAIEFLDSSLQDGLFRKYRVMSINGALYPIHMAISSGWKVHYFSSDMEDNKDYRDEERIFLNDFAALLGSNTISALSCIGQTLGLDYCGIDFGLDQNGKVLLYEANATMVLNVPTHEKTWDYRRMPIENALAATKKLFKERASLHP
jgi:Tfp pilus assembly protein PilF